MLADHACSLGVTLVEIPASNPTYTLASTVTRFPPDALKDALLSQVQQMIPLIKIQPLQSGYPAIYLSDRRCTIGSQLYLPRLVDFDGISQGMGNEADDATFTFGKPITFASVLKRFRDCDLIFGCTDDEWGRALLSRFCLEYLIPVFDLGAKIDSHEGTIRSIVGRVTVLLPGARCLFCRKQISAVGVHAQMMRELRPEEAEARRKEGYAPELGDPAPAVAAFTTATAALALTELLQRLVGFRGDDGSIDETIIRFDHGQIHTPGCIPLPDCFCLDSRVIGRGDRARFLDQAWRPE